MKDTYLFFKEIGIDLALMLAGLFGGVAFLSKPNEMNKAQKFLTVISGIGTANYLTPVFIYICRMPESFGYGVAFVLGYMGLKAVEYLILKWKSKQKNSEP